MYIIIANEVVAYTNAYTFVYNYTWYIYINAAVVYNNYMGQSHIIYAAVIIMQQPQIEWEMIDIIVAKKDV